MMNPSAPMLPESLPQTEEHSEQTLPKKRRAPRKPQAAHAAVAPSLEAELALNLPSSEAPSKPPKPRRRAKPSVAEIPLASSPENPLPGALPANSDALSPDKKRTRRAKSSESPLPTTPSLLDTSEEAPTQPKRGGRRKKDSAPSHPIEDLPRLTAHDGKPSKTEHYPAPQRFENNSQAHASPSESFAQEPALQQGTEDFPKKSYPVYVPRHIARQMEQEGKPAPLALSPDAAQAAEIRAAALENRLGSQSTAGVRAVSDSQEVQLPEEPAQAQQVSNQQPPQFREPSAPDHPRHGRHERQRGRHRHERHERHERHGKPDRHKRGEFSQDFTRPETDRVLPPPTPDELRPGGGIIEISGKGFGFLRDPQRGYAQHPADIFVSPELVRRFNLRDGQLIEGTVRRSGRGQQIHELQAVNGEAPEASKLQPSFDELTVINPCEPLRMETSAERYTTRIIDMFTPIGKGQRGLIVAPPRTGKTTLLQHIADSMMKNHPDVKLIMLLVDERPEEVTEIRHTVPKAEIMASSNDMDVRSHTRIAELAIERAKPLVEAGKDVFILLDSITRLGRAFNNALTNGGRTMSGGLDARALETPRKLFAAARNTEEAGSLTIIATALIETGSRMDEIIFQEFKGTGNMELVLDRKISEARIYPAVDIFQSGTRREELLVPADTLQKIHFLRRGLAGARPMDAIDRLLFYMKKFPTNQQMLQEIRAS